MSKKTIKLTWNDIAQELAMNIIEIGGLLCLIGGFIWIIRHI